GGSPGRRGSVGPSWGAAPTAKVVGAADDIEQLPAQKSPAELELIGESGRWCSLAHRLLQQYSRPGTTEAEASVRAQAEATLALFAEAGASGRLASGEVVKAGYRGQIGTRSSWAHAVAHNIEFHPGDVLVSETGAAIWGYQAELERTMVVGKPSDHVRWIFDILRASRQAAR